MKREKEPQYSKRALTRITNMWIFVCWYGVIFEAVKLIVQLIRCPDMVTATLSDLYLYTGAPLTGGVLGYMIKSALEEDKIQKYIQQHKMKRTAKQSVTEQTLTETITDFNITPVEENETEGV